MQPFKHSAFRSNVLQFFLILFLLSLGSPSSSAAEETDPLASLTKIDKIQRLPRDEAAKGHPVEITGTVIWRSENDFVVHDGEQGIWVGLKVARERGIWKDGEIGSHNTVIGTRLRISGVTDSGGYAPVILPAHFTHLGSGPLPEARHIPIDRLVAGSEDCQRIELEGVIQDVIPGSSEIKNLQTDDGETGTRSTHPPVNFAYLMTAGHLCRLVESDGALTSPTTKWVDAKVRIRGVFAADYNYRAEAIGMKLFISSADDIQILTPPPEDPFSAVKVPISRLMPFSPEGEPFHRKVTEGTVIFSVPGEFFFLQNGVSSVRVDTKSRDVQPGQRVEVAGFVDISQKLASLRNAQVKVLGTEKMPEPVPVSIEQLMGQVTKTSWGISASEDFSGKRVRLTGYLRRIDWKSSGAPQALWIEQSGQFFFAHLPLATTIPDELKTAFAEGAEIELIGISELKFENFAHVDGFYRLNGFRLWLASPADVKILHPAPWWTAGKLGLAFGVAAALLAITLIWNFSLRTILQRRTQRLEEVMQVHRNSELEYIGARRERQRLAGDLHDGMQQMLVGAAYRLEAASAEMGEVPPAVENQLQAARRAMERTQEGLREFIWGLNQVDDNIDDFESLLRHALGSVEHWPRESVFVVSTGNHFPLSRHIMGTLLLLVQEAAGNAFKHGQAARVHVTLHYTDSTLDMTIQDDGSGFDATRIPGPSQGHFGLESMANRMSWLGGTLKITSEPGMGCSVYGQLPKNRALLDKNPV